MQQNSMFIPEVSQVVLKFLQDGFYFSLEKSSIPLLYFILFNFFFFN